MRSWTLGQWAVRLMVAGALGLGGAAAAAAPAPAAPVGPVAPSTSQVVSPTPSGEPTEQPLEYVYRTMTDVLWT